MYSSYALIKSSERSPKYSINAPLCFMPPICRKPYLCIKVTNPSVKR